jgi:hypothetical protein
MSSPFFSFFAHTLSQISGVSTRAGKIRQTIWPPRRNLQCGPLVNDRLLPVAHNVLGTNRSKMCLTARSLARSEADGRLAGASPWHETPVLTIAS